MSDGNRNNEKRKIRALKHEKKKAALKGFSGFTYVSRMPSEAFFISN